MKSRNSRVELLRILSMFMIITHHYIYYGVYQKYLESPPEITGGGYGLVNKAVAHLLLPGGIIGVAIFFIIAGYFGIQNDKVKIKSIVFETASYSLLCFAIWTILMCCHVFPLKFSLEDITKCFFPCAGNTYWFVTTYIILMLFKPTINVYFRKLSNKQLICIFFLLILIYACLRITAGSLLGLYQGIVYYLAGVILYRFHHKIKKSPYAYALLGIIGWLGYAFFEISHLGGQLSGVMSTTIMGTVSALGIAAFFLYGKECDNYMINKIGASTFAVYLIHENPFLRETLWSKILHVETFQMYSSFFPLLACLSVTGVFVVCIMIDLIKKNSLNKLFYKLSGH